MDEAETEVVVAGAVEADVCCLLNMATMVGV
jgi:hypothetical protein